MTDSQDRPGRSRSALFLVVAFLVLVGITWLLVSQVQRRSRERAERTVSEQGMPVRAPLVDPPGVEPDSIPPVASDPPPEPRIERGVKVTFEPVFADAEAQMGSDTRRDRMIALHVGRGAAPTPFLSPGPFRAFWEAVLPIPVRDRYRFKAEGKGSFDLSVNGEQVLAGRLGGDTPVESEPRWLKKGDNRIAARFTSGAHGDGTVRLYWSSSEFGWEPIPPALWRHDAADRDTARGMLLRRGRELLAQRRCTRCHQPEQPFGEKAMAELEWSGPDLTRLGSRVRTGWIAQWLRDPHAHRTDATMPQFRLDDADVRDLMGWLGSLGEPRPLEAPFVEDQVFEGEARFYELGCVACHVPPEEPPEPPDGERIHLGFVSDKWHAAALVDYLQAPQEHYRHIRMPDLKLSAEDASALAAFLVRDQTVAARLGRADAARGANLASSLGCARCHALPNEDGSAFPPLPGLDVAKGCLGSTEAERGNAPKHNLEDADVDALRAVLRTDLESLRRRVSAEFAERLIRVSRCTACHAYEGQASTWERVARVLAAEEPLPPEMDPVAQGVPDLTWLGGKLKPQWMRAFVTGQLPSPRPWNAARMPAFPVHGAEVVAGLLHQHGYADGDSRDDPPIVQLIAQGRRLVSAGEGFGCGQCHGIGEQGPTQVFERQGINFRFTGDRLRKEYYTRWLADPTRIDTNSRMPKYSDDRGKTAFAMFFDGDAVRQFEAIWHYIQTVE